MNFKKALEESKRIRQQGSKSDRFMYRSKENKFASKKWGKFDWSQVNNPNNDSDDAKDFKKAVKHGNRAYLTKVNMEYKVKI